ncbi:cation transport regulator-like protein 2-like protein [Polychytrium aggregatum]|uniref:cation transport regulator-like protein 2-like protein n=1 Tax=Polychytrium aggregatum TaxID=110093 RepID=UPI0022FE6A80|nr:cation transport regulator-like protein 2-like protein [Polychytrium aggregatum]KAI9207850.1 cation transport regulator-like protein 2-like protein [Polychytrium aggregatum]
MWVFGYGSLIWKVDFPYEVRIPGYICGFVRRFWQGSHDHRGTPESPGRVVTLLPYSEWQTLSDRDFAVHQRADVCWGVAYKVAPKDEAWVRAHLDHREKNGYESFKVPVYHPLAGSDQPIVQNAMVYLAGIENEAFLGPETLDHMGVHIAHSRGPSGQNYEYLFGLYKSLKALVPDFPDEHVEQLTDRVVQALKDNHAFDPSMLENPKFDDALGELREMSIWTHERLQERLDFAHKLEQAEESLAA